MEPRARGDTSHPARMRGEAVLKEMMVQFSRGKKKSGEAVWGAPETLGRKRSV